MGVMKQTEKDREHKVEDNISTNDKYHCKN